MNEEHGHQHEHSIHYEVNAEPQSTTDREMTPVQILQKAEIDPAKNYLVELRGKEKISFKDNPNEPIKMHNEMKFISVSTGPKPVSYTYA